MESAPPGMWEITPAAIILIIIVGVVLGSRIPGDSLDLCAAGPLSAPAEAARGWAAWCLSSLAPCREELAPRPPPLPSLWPHFQVAAPPRLPSTLPPPA